jgi:uncharacterized protein YwgA
MSILEPAMGQIKSNKDLLMLLLYAKGKTGSICEPIVGKTRLVKMIFLFDKEIRKKFNLDKIIPDEIMPDFKACDFGPFSADVYKDLEFLVELGFIEVQPVDEEMLPDEVGEYEYWQAISGDSDRPYQEKFLLTEIGKKFVEKKLLSEFQKQQLEVFDSFKERCTSTSLASLLKYVYSRYPEQTTHSKIRDKVLGF